MIERTSYVTVPIATDRKEYSMVQELHLTTLHISNVIQAASFVVACAIAQVAFPQMDFERCKQYIGFFLSNVI